MLAGDDAIWSSVAAGEPPKPTANTTTPSAFTVAASDVPGGLDSPSVSSISTRDAPARDFCRVIVLAPVVIAAPMLVVPPWRSPSILVLSVELLVVSCVSTVAAELNLVIEP